MKIFVCEFITGGGLARNPLPPALAREGGMMVSALVADLQELPGIRVIASRDVRLPPLPAGVEVIRAGPDADLPEVYALGLAATDAAWPIAPEAGGALERLARAAIGEGRRLLGCRPEAIRTAASKRATASALRAAAIPVVPTYGASDELPPLPGPWVVKPDDGAGCDGALVVADYRAARSRLGAEPERLVAQPWLEGIPASLSVVCANGQAQLLACNRQVVRIGDGRVALDGLAVNGIRDSDGRLGAIARSIASAIPGLWGYIGVDLVCTDHGPMVLEVNPRLTTSYCGLRAALGINAAATVLDLLAPPGQRGWQPPPEGRPIDIALASRV